MHSKVRARNKNRNIRVGIKQELHRGKISICIKITSRLTVKLTPMSPEDWS
jgi:hypothetical protein